MTLLEDLRFMCAGPLGVTVTGPDGDLFGLLDIADEENWRIGDFGRHQTRLDRHTQLVIPAADQGTIARASSLVINGISYTVQDLRLATDGLELQLLLVAQ
jgi:hypothetical protein